MIETINLNRKFGSFTAVDNLNLKIDKAEIFGFLGANGAGKTTTLRMLCGLLTPSSGTITVNGLNVVKNPEAVKRSLGYMSQKFSLYGDLRGIENLQFYTGIYGISWTAAKTNIKSLISQFDLDKYLKLKTSELPMGYKQRLSLVCALVHNPPLVFLDEPTSGVDPKARREFWQVINELAYRGKTVIVSTHFMDEAEYCNRVLIMQAGREEVCGNPLQLKQSHRVATMQQLFLKIAGADNAQS